MPGCKRRDEKPKSKQEEEQDSSTLALQQPTHGNPYSLMNIRNNATGCSRDLAEALCFVDNLLVKQRVQPLEFLTGYEQGNKYDIFNGLGQRVMVAAEDTDCCTRNCCGRSRPWKFLLMNPKGKEVIHLSRRLRGSSCWCPCCLQEVKVFSPPGHLIGRICQNWSLCFPHFSVKDESGKILLRISGPFCKFSCVGSDVVFQLLSKDKKTVVGRITKEWSGLLKEALTDSDNYSVFFPLDLDVKCKALLLGATILIDFMFFEDNAPLGK